MAKLARLSAKSRKLAARATTFAPALAILVLASGLSGGEPLADGPPQSNRASQSAAQRHQSAASASDKLPVNASSDEARALYEAES